MDFDDYAVVGIPEEFIDRNIGVSVLGEKIIGGVKIAMMFGSECNAKPKGSKKPMVPWLALKLRDKKEIKSVKGMSGGPIFGFKKRANKSPLYTVVAVQSSWDNKRRIAFGSLLWPVIGLIDMDLRAMAEEAKRKKKRKRKKT